MRQLKSMFQPTRLIATIIYLVALVGTIVVAVAVPIHGVCECNYY